MKSFYWTLTTFNGDYPQDLWAVIYSTNQEIDRQRYQLHLDDKESDVLSDKLWEQYCRDTGRPVTKRLRSKLGKYRRQMTDEQIIRVPFDYLMNAIGMSQAALSRLHKIPARTLQHWRSGDRACPAYVRIMLAELHGLRVADDLERRRVAEEEALDPCFDI